jgi:hypothetical protein
LQKIKDWIDNTEEDVLQVLWLSGTAGKSKSAIAHTTVNWFLERGDPGAFFCFDLTRAANCRHEKLFTTIAIPPCGEHWRKQFAMTIGLGTRKTS